tara:strand:- start:1820 stop:2452 length:633 start_codon:yes stop_codon:yes gene_type:complete
MAENKKSVLLYCDIIHTVKELSDEEAGILFKHYLSYINDQNPTPKDKLTQIVFEPIKQNLKRDLEKWKDKSIKNKEIAIAGWEKRKNANASESIKEDANDADKVKDKVIDINKEIDFVIFLDWFNKTTNRNFKSIPEATKKSFKARIKEGYTKDDICKAVINCSKDKFHIENPKYLTPEFISRADKLALYLNAPNVVIDLRNPKNLPVEL